MSEVWLADRLAAPEPADPPDTVRLTAADLRAIRAEAERIRAEAEGI